MEEIQMMINDKENSFTLQTEDSDRDDGDGSGDAIIEHDGVSGTLVSYFKPIDQPNHMIRLNKSPLSNITTKNFKQLCLEKFDGTQNSIPAKKVARKGINPYASIVTSDAEFAKAQAEVEEKDREVLRKEEAKTRYGRD